MQPVTIDIAQMLAVKIAQAIGIVRFTFFGHAFYPPLDIFRRYVVKFYTIKILLICHELLGKFYLITTAY